MTALSVLFSMPRCVFVEHRVECDGDLLLRYRYRFLVNGVIHSN